MTLLLNSALLTALLLIEFGIQFNGEAGSPLERYRTVKYDYKPVEQSNKKPIMNKTTPIADNNNVRREGLSLQQGWQVVNDSVMGGISRSSFRFDSRSHVLVFSGQLSLANNGGFVSIRRGVPEKFFTLKDALCLKYKLNQKRIVQLRLRDNLSFDGVAYVVEVEGTGEYQQIEVPLETFKPRFRGIDLSADSRVRPKILAENIVQFGLLVADKRTEPFELHVKSIEACQSSLQAMDA